jgi:hypothetical protein
MAVAALLPSLLGQVVNGPVVARAADQAPKVANPHGDYREDCSLCHRASGWKPARISKKFDHDKFLPLGGAHASVDCMQCHKSLDFGGVSTACVDCHADVHNGELGTDCSRCHGTRSFVDRNDQDSTASLDTGSRWRARTRRWTAKCATGSRRRAT